jgi:SAM-dependent methyltransferase
MYAEVMTSRVDLYNSAYDKFAARVQERVRAETYGEDVGQSSWMTADELRHFARQLRLKATSHVLEIGSGSGGPALWLAKSVGCRVTGLDVNKFGIRNSNQLARELKLQNLARFQLTDASRTLPFPSDTFEAVFSNDAMCHISGRAAVLDEWFRVLKPGGRMLFTDAMVITGLVSHEEIATRSSIGRYFYLPPGENERLIEAAGFVSLRREDLTANAAAVSKRWRDARARRRNDLLKIEGRKNFEGLQKFLACVHLLSQEQRVSRFMYVARKPAN